MLLPRPALVGSGNLSTISFPNELNRDAGIMLLGNGVRLAATVELAGSYMRCVSSEKSPLRMAVVGTVASWALLRTHGMDSALNRKKVRLRPSYTLGRITGPEKVPPNWL